MLPFVLGTAAASASAVVPSAFTQLTGNAGCVMQIGYDVDHGCARAGGLDQVRSVTLSPDDKFVYVASGGSLSGGSNGVVVFARDAQTGALEQAGCVTAGGGDGRVGSEQACARGDALLGAADVAIAPDGRTAYVASAVSGGLAWLARDPATGALTPAGCVKDFPRADHCAEAPGLTGAASVAVSPDGNDVYVGSPAPPRSTCSPRRLDGIAHLRVVRLGDRFRRRLLAGRRPAERARPRGGSRRAGRLRRRRVGRGDRVRARRLDRRPERDRVPARRSAVAGTLQSAAGISGAAGVAVSPDSRDVYVAAPDSDAVTSFRVQPDGTLRQTGCLQRVPSSDDALPLDAGCEAATAVWDPRVLVISGDGATVFAGGADTITSYHRDAATGTLRQLGCAEEEQSSASCLESRATFGVNAIAASRDGRNVYSTADEENAVTVLGAAVAIVSSAVRADRRGRVRVLLSCPAARAMPCGGRCEPEARRAPSGSARAPSPACA